MAQYEVGASEGFGYHMPVRIMLDVSRTNGHARRIQRPKEIRPSPEQVKDQGPAWTDAIIGATERQWQEDKARGAIDEMHRALVHQLRAGRRLFVFERHRIEALALDHLEEHRAPGVTDRTADRTLFEAQSGL